MRMQNIKTRNRCSTFCYLDCSCIAAVAALAHFKRPDVTTTGDGEFIIHKPTEKDLVPIVLHHYPICVTYALFNDGKIPVADPTALEERVSDASLVLAVNSYKELCCMHLAGVSLTSPNLILRCSEMAAGRSKRIVDFIKSTLEEDETQRSLGNLPKGFAECIKLSSIPSNFHDEEHVEKDEQESETSELEDESEPEEIEPVTKLDSKTAASSQLESNESSESSDEDEEMEKSIAHPKNANKEMKMEANDSSEEEETVVLK